MLWKIFKENILKSSYGNTTDTENGNLTAEEQIEILDDRIVSNTHIKLLSTYSKIDDCIDSSIELRNNTEDEDIIAEYNKVIDYLKRSKDKKKNKIFCNYDDFYNRLEVFAKEKSNNEEYGYNAVLFLLFAYEGIKTPDDLAMIRISDFHTETNRGTNTSWIDLNGKIIPINRKTYDFVMDLSTKYIEYMPINAKRSYVYSPFVCNNGYSPFRYRLSKDSNVTLTKEKILSLKSNNQKFFTEIKMDVPLAYNYGRFENIFELEIEYSIPEKLSDEKADKLFEECIKNLYGAESSRVIKDYRTEYLAWRKIKIKSLLND